MNGSYLLDTNIVIALFARDTSITGHLTATTTIFIPSIVLGELYFGARKSARAEVNVARIDAFLSGNTILAVDALTAQQYGQIKDALRLKGRPIPENDLWIAAIALQHHLTLVTRDEHFREIAALPLERW